MGNFIKLENMFGTSIKSYSYKFLSIKFEPLLSVTKNTLNLFLKCSKKAIAGITCPPDPPVEINIFFTTNLFFFLLNLK